MTIPTVPESLVVASPFRNVGSFEMPAEGAPALMALTSPFVEAFAYEGVESAPADAAAGVRRALLAELHDEELDDAIYELVGELAASAGEVAPELRSYTLNASAAPLIAEIEAFIQEAANALGAREAASLTESEIDTTLSRIGSSRAVSPEFERLFGGLKNAISRAAKGAITLAKKGVGAALTLGLGPVLNKLKGLVRPLIERVLRSAINRLPPALRPAATALAGNLPRLFQSETEPDTSELAFDISGIQSEFNDRVADLFLVESEAASDEELAQDSRDELGANGADAVDARERFIGDLERLEDGADVSPAVERFIPALLVGVKLALKLAGRKRVVRFLSGLVSKLIGRFVGPTQTVALSTAMVDAGLRVIGLEISENDQRRAAHQAIVSTVEETVRRVAALPDGTLDNETLLEGSIVRAFEAAAAANLPAVLPAHIYRQRPELAETDARQAAWIPWPVRGRRSCFKKFGQIIRTRITPHAALAVTTFGGAPLAQFMQEELGLEVGEETDADVHVYEAVAGTNLAEVARLEGEAGGATHFHPLTQEAAALLLREPGLARAGALAGAVAGAARNLGVGQRVFRIALPGRRLPSIQKGSRPRRTGLYTLLNFRADRIRLYLYLSERRAQELAAALRKQGHVGTLATSLKGFIDRGLAAATQGTGKIRLIHEALPLAQALGAALARLPQSATHAFMSRLGECALTALSDFLSKQSAKFIAATEDAKDGVTLVITLGTPPGLATLRKALAGTAVANGGASLAAQPESVDVRVVAGFTNG